MSKEVLESLKQSVREAGAIMRGETPPSREFVREYSGKRQKPKTALAICLSSDDDELLIPGKVYEVKILNAHLGVIDETGEMVLCSPEDFVIVNLEPKIEQLLRAASVL